MKTDFMLAITQLSAEKHLPKDVVLSAVETALVSAYKKGNLFSPDQDIVVRISPASGEVRVYVRRVVVEEVADPEVEISLAEAQKVNTSAAVGEVVEIEDTPKSAGRIAAQTARQVILQRLHEAEHNAVFEEYSAKEGDVVTGSVERVEPRGVLIDLGRNVEALLPASEQAKNERYRVGQRLRVYVTEVTRTGRGPQVVVSRAHRNLLRRLFELEIPEIYNGVVEIKSVAREAGQRSKVGVAARQPGVDPVGCCVGLRGIRIQSIVNELNGEKIDVVAWHPDPAVFISNALSPAQIGSVELDEALHTATVIVPDKQLSLAIGKEGQNARLAAKMTGWRIDIKSTTAAEAKKAEAQVAAQKAAAVIAEAEKVVAEAGAPPAVQAAAEKVAPAPVPAEPAVSAALPEAAAGAGVLEKALAPAAPEAEEVEEALPLEVALSAPGIFAPPKRERAPAEPGQIRFAEDILAGRMGRGGKRGKKAKEAGAEPKPKKAKRARVYGESEEV
ncbi:MAG: transcription termination/antitermination protein NusA [Chloroflexi bacterium]|nr:transcription termination/antitermination protein NusA [Chloroflexota bacterium]